MHSTVGRSNGKLLPRVKCVRYRIRVRIVLLVVLALIGEGSTGWAVAAEAEGPPRPSPHWRVSVMVNYSSGSYGTDYKTNIVYAPMTIRRIFRDGDVSLTIPFISISGTGAVRLVGGVPTRTGSVSGGTAATASSGAGRGKSPGAIPLSSSTTDSGLGDNILRGRYYLIEESTILPLVALIGKIKFPPADADHGLGTDEFDEGFGVELTKSLSDRWLAYLDGGYTFVDELGSGMRIDLLIQS